MKICYFTYYSRSGALIHINEFTKAIKILNPDFKNYHLGAEKVYAENTEPNVSKGLFLHDVKKILYNLLYLWKELNILNIEKPDVVIARTSLYGFSSILSAKFKKIPIILEVNSPLAFEYKEYYKGTSFIAHIIEKYVMNTANAILVISGSLKEYLISTYKVNPNKIFINPNGFDPSKFNFTTDEILGVPVLDNKEGIIIGFVGSFQIWHGLDALIDVFSELIKEKKNVYLLLIGGGPQIGFIRRKTIEKCLTDRIIFTGVLPHEKVHRYLSKIDIAVIPSAAWYCSPIKLFEYMAMGKAIIAPNNGPLNEIIINEKEGLLVDNDKRVLKDKLLFLMDNEEVRIRFGENAKIKAYGNYTWVDNAKRVLEVCGNVCKGSSN